MRKIYQISFLPFLFFSFALGSTQKNITFLIAEREYKTEKTLPKFAEKFLSENFSTKFCNAPNEGLQRNHISNSSSISNADLLFVSVRRRAFKENIMNLIRSHITKGKPVIGIRTASHAFQLRKEKLPNGHQEWTEWDKEIIGGNYNGHLGKGLICMIDPHLNNSKHIILNGLKLPFSTPATLYRNSPLPKSSRPLLIGSVKGYPDEPVAWIRKTTSGGRVFYTSLGHIEDFRNPNFNLLLKNAINWCLE